MIQRTEDGHEIEGDGFYTLHCTGYRAQQATEQDPTDSRA